MIELVRTSFRQSEWRPMKWLINSTLLLLLLNSAGQQVFPGGSGEPVTEIAIIDSKPVEHELDTIVSLICNQEGSEQRAISRQSSILKLAQHFKEEEKAVSFKCKNSHYLREALGDLSNVLETDRERVCSSRKASLIEKFHLEHMQTVDRPKGETLPDSLKSFFVHYALKVSLTCQEALVGKLRGKYGKSFVEGDGITEKTIESLSRLFGSKKNIHDYDDILLLWELVEDSLQSIGTLEGSESSARTVPKEVRVKLSQPKMIWALQKRCQSIYKPVYAELILPLIRLSELGYSNANKKTGKKEKKLVGRWYMITQVCEALLPIKFYRSASMKANEITLISQKEAEGLQSMQGLEGAEHSSPEVSDVLEDQLTEVATLEPKNLLKKVKQNQTKGLSKLRRTLRRFSRKFRSLAKSVAPNLVLADTSESIKVDSGKILKRKPTTLSVEELRKLRNRAHSYQGLEIQRAESARKEEKVEKRPLEWTSIMSLSGTDERGALQLTRRLLADLFLGLFTVILAISKRNLPSGGSIKMISN